MIRTHNRKKLIDAILYFANNTKFLGKIKLMKLLYFLDFYHFRETGKSVTGLDYFAWERGPVPRELFVEISNIMKPDLQNVVRVVPAGKMQRIVAKQKFNGKHFSLREMKLLEKLAYIFSDAKADDMVEVSHLPNQPWERTLKERGEWQKIDYLLAVDSTGKGLSLEQIKERMAEISEMHGIFGVD
jgi:uncharacterized phage-associated protein